MGIGPIPWDRIKDYAIMSELDFDFINSFIRIIRAMDNAYIKWDKDNPNK
jgi:hypothetical protein